VVDLLSFIAKWDESGHTHPLVYHMLDSGAVAQALWQTGLTPGVREQFCTWLNLEEEAMGQLLAYWTSLHDLGKASRSFQGRCQPAVATLEAEGYAFPELVPQDVRHHSLLSAWILEAQKERLHLQPSAAVRKLLLALAGHHGQFPSFLAFNEDAYRAVNLGDAPWREAQVQLVIEMENLFQPPEEAHLKSGQSVVNAFFNLLTGLFITADWLSSNTGLFPYHAANLSPAQYLAEVSRPVARQALHVTGWGSWQPAEQPLTFGEIFPQITPNTIQKGVLDYLDQLKDPFLMILEAPTGSGKTEIALSVADIWMQCHNLRGFYMAMPTQATSDQMFDRVTAYLEHRYTGQLLNVQLAHGNAALKKEYEAIQLAGIADDEADATSGVNALSWFTPRKLTLLAPFGVGTVDQTFLSVLQARHFALRLFGLARKVVIFDEVHAYDVYMVEIFKRLLGWLRAIGSSVIILSATLPAETRQELLSAYDPEAYSGSKQADFPRLSLNSGGRIVTESLGAVPDRTVHLDFIGREPEEIVAALHQKLSKGGCAGVICNTVKRAQQVYAAVKASGQFPPEDVLLFHARYPFCWREERQQQVLGAFGRLQHATTDCRRQVVIATQVIEQSLDLDFDLLISDLAPLDLLIQRIGRLQRHSGMPFPPRRPASLGEPLCLISVPDPVSTGLPDFEKGDTYIYEEVFLQRSYFTLLGRTALSLPGDSDALIGAVYSDADLPELTPAQNAALHRLHQQMLNRAGKESLRAESHLIADVDYDESLGKEFDDLAEDDPRVHQELQALTRDVRPTVKLVCLEQSESGDLYTLDGHQPLQLDRAPSRELTHALLRSAITISDWRVVKALRNQPLHPAWKQSASLRYLFPLQLDPQGRGKIGEVACGLDPELGFWVEEE
jgi:CRISPR-associated endonuclease/helicase Cas3